ncbi:MAG: hypothetical protein EPO40_35220 [Myxococcaceae bacterium]|nr:MAG: hypothetical protein EPO40_35220 [Myxococcaceae bacterium]
MSYDISIVSQTTRVPSWSEVLGGLPAEFGDASLLTLQGGAVEPSEPLATDECYVVGIDDVMSIGLTPMPFGSEDLPPDLAEFAPNLPADLRAEVATRWLEAGYDLALTSTMGRTAYDPKLMAALAAALATVVRGYVYVSTPWRLGGTYLPRGVYSPAEFLTGVGFDILQGRESEQPIAPQPPVPQIRPSAT